MNILDNFMKHEIKLWHIFIQKQEISNIHNCETKFNSKYIWTETAWILIISLIEMKKMKVVTTGCLFKWRKI